MGFFASAGQAIARTFSRKPARAQRSLMRNTGADDGYTVVALDQWLNAPAYKGGALDPNAPAMELPLYGIAPTAIVASVAEALAQLEQGSFYSAAYLWDGMQRDDRVQAKLGERVDALFGAKLQLLPADKSTAAKP